MDIEFSRKHSIDPESGGINFWAKVDGKTVQCMVSIEALQDYRPSNARKDPELLFELYKADIENIAEEKILSPGFNWGKVLITTADMP
jgi:hypothetical protein